MLVVFVCGACGKFTFVSAGVDMLVPSSSVSSLVLKSSFVYSLVMGVGFWTTFGSGPWMPAPAAFEYVDGCVGVLLGWTRVEKVPS